MYSQKKLGTCTTILKNPTTSPNFSQTIFNIQKNYISLTIWGFSKIWVPQTIGFPMTTNFG